LEPPFTQAEGQSRGFHENKISTVLKKRAIELTLAKEF